MEGKAARTSKIGPTNNAAFEDLPVFFWGEKAGLKTFMQVLKIKLQCSEQCMPKLALTVRGHIFKKTKQKNPPVVDDTILSFPLSHSIFTI